MVYFLSPYNHWWWRFITILYFPNKVPMKTEFVLITPSKIPFTKLSVKFFMIRNKTIRLMCTVAQTSAVEVSAGHLHSNYFS